MGVDKVSAILYNLSVDWLSVKIENKKGIGQTNQQVCFIFAKLGSNSTLMSLGSWETILSHERKTGRRPVPFLFSIAEKKRKPPRGICEGFPVCLPLNTAEVYQDFLWFATLCLTRCFRPLVGNVQPPVAERECVHHKS